MQPRLSFDFSKQPTSFYFLHSCRIYNHSDLGISMIPFNQYQTYRLQTPYSQQNNSCFLSLCTKSNNTSDLIFLPYSFISHQNRSTDSKSLFLRLNLNILNTLISDQHWKLVLILEGQYTMVSQFAIIFLKRHMPKNTVAPAKQLNIQVKSQDGEKVNFKIKSTTQMKKVMKAYCQNQKLQSEDVRFLFEGERLSETTTSEDLNMQNGADINAVIHQTGG